MNEAILTAISNRRPFSIITANGHSTHNEAAKKPEYTIADSNQRQSDYYASVGGREF